MSYCTKLLTSMLLLTLIGCDSPADTHNSAMGGLMGETTSDFTQVLPDKEIRFPSDHLAHDGFRQEWWYLTANLTIETGAPLGLQWTQFRIALSAEAPKSSSNWASNQLYMAHSAITTGKHHQAEERWSRGQPQLAGVSAVPLTIELDNWRWQSQDEELFPATLDVAGDSVNYSLRLTTSAPYQLQGEGGYSVKSADASVASYYYSQPFIDVSGRVMLDGKFVQVSGKAWLDREWSSQFLTRQQQGWDWFALRLDDGSTLMLFQLRGDVQEASSKHFYSGRRMYADGRGETITSNDISMTPTAWQTIDGKTYPVEWQIRIDNQAIELQISPLNPNAKMPLSITYWEGPVSIEGSHTGSGYMELTGY
ncbi:carotenoid 1,2-hydratase [Shewanella mesophila]|uniref:lipocalin-like domain-containing protein n=1 Tax=Shewanella mesophila TaxID=2864208 RepID=UPI001C654BA4|nr:lipocalin-like domain-containing protein [Shewanella mesophila]QYJ85707.1 carotenoid 1,2-hydratase [Shewanella mesophila]